MAPPFRFLDLPAEIRIRVYEILLGRPKVVDLEASNYYTLAPVLRVFLTSRQLHDEAYQVFYSVNTFRLFSTDGRFFQAKKPLLARLSPRYRAVITSLELRLGQGWQSPPKRWIVTPKMGLSDCKALKRLEIFVEMDPTASKVTSQWLKRRSLFTDFSTALLVKIYDVVPSIVEARFDSHPDADSVQQDGELMVALVGQAKEVNKRVTYGPLRGWTNEVSSTKGLSSDEETMLSTAFSHMWPTVHAF